MYQDEVCHKSRRQAQSSKEDSMDEWLISLVLNSLALASLVLHSSPACSKMQDTCPDMTLVIEKGVQT